MIRIAQQIRRLAQDLVHNEVDYWKDRIQTRYGITVSGCDDGTVIRQIYFILNPVPTQLIKDCGITKIVLRDLGPNLPHYPNHGWFVGDEITLNIDIFLHPDEPDDFVDHRGFFLTRAQQTLLHELGHALDKRLGDLSLQDPWMRLSGWSKEYRPGLKKLIIRDPGAPEVIGEYFYDPSIARFTRFYGARNPYDDLADCFAFFVGGLKNKVPPTKRDYFKALLKKYY